MVSLIPSYKEILEKTPLQTFPLKYVSIVEDSCLPSHPNVTIRNKHGRKGKVKFVEGGLAKSFQSPTSHASLLIDYGALRS